MTSPLHHVGYVVEDLEEGIERFRRDLGTGPFEVLGRVPLEEVTWEGRPGAYDHSTAFAAWGPILVEVSQIHSAEPAGAEALMPQPKSGLGHVGFVVADIDAETERLERAGWELFHTGRGGPVRAHYLRGPLGHPLELISDCPEVQALYARVRARA